VTSQPVITKAELLRRLRISGGEAVRRLRELDPASFESGRYENGWNGREILAHISSIEWTYRRLIEVAAEASPRTAEDRLPTRQARGGIDAYNARQVEKRADATVDELISEFETNRAATIEAVAAAEESVFSKPLRSAGGITGPLASVLNAVAVEHVLGHVADIAGDEYSGRQS
jgi:hypothetical protein